MPITKDQILEIVTAMNITDETSETEEKKYRHIIKLSHENGDDEGINVGKELSTFGNQMSLKFDSASEFYEEKSFVPNTILKILGFDERKKQNWISKSPDGTLHEEEAKQFFFQRLLLDLYKDELVTSANAIYGPDQFKNGVSNDKTSEADLLLYAKFNGLKEEGEIPENYEYKAFLGLVRKSINEAPEGKAFTISTVLDAVEQQQQRAAVQIQRVYRGSGGRKKGVRKKALAGLMMARDELARLAKAEAEKLARLAREEESARLVQVNQLISEGENDGDEVGRYKGGRDDGDGDGHNDPEGGDHVISEKSIQIKESRYSLFLSDKKEGVSNDSDDEKSHNSNADDNFVDVSSVEGSDRSTNSSDLVTGLDKKEREVRYFEDEDEDSVNNDGEDINLDQTFFEESDNDEIVQGYDRSGNEKFHNEYNDSENFSPKGSDHSNNSLPDLVHDLGDEINKKRREVTVPRDDESVDGDEDDDHDHDHDHDEDSLDEDHHSLLKKYRLEEYLGLEPRNIDYQHLRDNHYVSSKDKKENYLIPEITGTIYEDDFPTGKVLQYHSGLPVSYYENLNDFSQDADKAAEKEWDKNDNRLLSSIAYIEDKNIGAKYCVVNASVRGVTKIFISDQEFDKIKTEANSLFLKKFGQLSPEKKIDDDLTEVWPEIALEEELMCSVSQEFSKKIAQDVEKSIGNEMINGLDTLEVESIAEDFVKTHKGKNSFGKDVYENKGGLKGEISKILEAPVPHTNLNGVGFHRPRENKIVSVGFSYNNAGDEGKLEGNTEAYAYISGSYQCYIRCQVCPQDGKMSFYKNGKPISKEFKRGDTVIDQNTISFLNPKTGEYTNVKASIVTLDEYLKSNEDYRGGNAASILEKYNAMQIKVTSQVNRVDFKEEEPDIERKVSIMHKGRILSYNGEETTTSIGKKKIAEKIFDSESNPIDYSSLNDPSIEKFVKINKITLPNGEKAPLYAKLSADAEKVTHQSEPFVKIKGKTQLSKLTLEIMKKSYSDETLAQKLFSRVKHDFKNTKLILGKENEEYKISTPEGFTGPGSIVVSPSGDVSQPKVTSLFDVKELWIKDRVIGSLNNR